MTTFAPQNIVDLVATTQRDLGPMRFQQIGQEYVHYEVFSKWFKKDKVTFDSGFGIQKNLMTAFNRSAARHVSYTENDSTSLVDVIKQLRVNWVHATTHWGIIYQTDILMNSGKSLVLNILKPRRIASIGGLVEVLEEKAWGSPPSSSDEVNPWGIKYWVTSNATTGFNGGAPSGHSSVANIDLSTVPNFKNYTAQYTSVTKADLIKKMRRAHKRIRFVSPLNVRDYRGGVSDRYRIYVNESVQSNIEDLAEGQNSALGYDIASMDGAVYFKRHPIIEVPILDDETTDPVFMIDHASFYPVFLQGDYLRENPPVVHPNKHNVYIVNVDLTYNYLNVDRRRCARFDTAA